MKIDPKQRYYNIIRKIEVSENGDVEFYFTGMDKSLQASDFIARTKNRKRLSTIEASIREHNAKELERFHRRND